MCVAEAVPKRILDLMNVDGLTRENVASHLQVGSSTFVAHFLLRCNLISEVAFDLLLSPGF